MIHTCKALGGKTLLVLLLSMCIDLFLFSSHFFLFFFSTFLVVPFFFFPLIFLQAFPIYIPLSWVILLHLMMVRLFCTFCLSCLFSRERMNGIYCSILLASICLLCCSCNSLVTEPFHTGRCNASENIALLYYNIVS